MADAAVIYPTAESPLKRRVIWAATNDGQVCLTEDGGAVLLKRFLPGSVRSTNTTPQRLA